MIHGRKKRKTVVFLHRGGKCFAVMPPSYSRRILIVLNKARLYEAG